MINSTTRSHWFQWIPRGITILAILLVSMFAADAFQSGFTFWQNLWALFVHLIPSFVLLIILIIAWKWELLGGLLFILVGVGMSPFIYRHNVNVNHFTVAASMKVLLIITFPFVVAGVLFIISHVRRRKQQDRLPV